MNKQLIDTDELIRLRRDADDNKSLMRIVRMIVLGVIAIIVFFTIFLVIANTVIDNWEYSRLLEETLSHFNGEITIDDYIKIVEIITK